MSWTLYTYTIPQLDIIGTQSELNIIHNNWVGPYTLNYWAGHYTLNFRAGYYTQLEIGRSELQLAYILRNTTHRNFKVITKTAFCAGRNCKQVKVITSRHGSNTWGGGGDGWPFQQPGTVTVYWQDVWHLVECVQLRTRVIASSGYHFPLLF